MNTYDKKTIKTFTKIRKPGFVVWDDAREGGFITGYIECDTILMDIRMPVLDGLEATRRIRKLDRRDVGMIPIIAMSANAYAEDIEKSREAGIDKHLSKPIDPNILYQTLTDIFKKKQI